MDAPGQVPDFINCHACNSVIRLAGHQAFTHAECPQCGAISVVPLKFGNFLLLNPIGVGGMGTVYRAIDLPLNRYVAVKVLRRKLAANPEFIARFAREARAAAAVSHPNIAQVYSFGRENDEYYLAMELLERGSLDDRLSSMGKLPERDVLEIGLQIAHGLRAAYQRGLLHLDIKPANILFNNEGVAKLVDFGLARIQEQQPQPPDTAAAKSEQLWGTPYYVAPEKLHGQPEDFRSDIYSLGATLFHALAGRPPFDAPTPGEVVSKHATQPAYSLKTFAPTVHNFTAHVIGRMLAKNPAERYPSYDHLIRDLNEALAAVKLAESPQVVVASTGERFGLLSVIGTLVALAACVALAWYVWQKLLQPTTTPRSSFPAGAATPSITTAADTTVVDFNEDSPWVKAWNVATLQLAQGRYHEAYLAYDSALHLLRSADQLRHRQWVHFFQGISMQAADRPAEAIAHFTRAIDLHVKPHIPASITTGNFVDPLAQVMLGGLTLSDLEQARTNMPLWAAALTYLVAGFKYLEQHNLNAAAAAFREYARSQKDPEQPWAFHLQPLAERLANECDRTAAAMARLEAQIQAGDLEQALQQARDLQQHSTLPGLQLRLTSMISDIENALSEKRQREQQLAEAERQQQREREQQQRLAFQRDQQLLQTQHAAVTAALNRYDYLAALSLLDNLAPSLQTAYGRAVLQQRIGALRLLIQFKEQLSSDFVRSPYDSAQLQTRHSIRLIGQLARATDSQLIFQTPHGELVAEWRDLTPTSLARIAEHYIHTLGQVERSEELARRYLRLAAFCQQHGLERAVPAYLAQAEQLHPAIRAEIEAVFEKPAEPPADN